MKLNKILWEYKEFFFDVTLQKLILGLIFLWIAPYIAVKFKNILIQHLFMHLILFIGFAICIDICFDIGILKKPIINKKEGKE